MEYQQLSRLPEDDEADANLADSRRIGVAIILSSMGNIQTVQQSFDASLNLALEWFPLEKEIAEYEQDPVVWQPTWCPRFTLPNAINISTFEIEKNKGGKEYSMLTHGTKDNYERLVVLPAGRKYVIAVRYQVTATFMEEMEIANFPFDCQDFQLTLRLTQPVESAHLVPHFRREKFFKLSTKYLTISDWDIHPSTVTFRMSGETDSMFADKFRYSVVAVGVMLQRNPKYYMQRVVMLLFIITSCTGMCFCLDPVDAASDRLSILFTLLLTAVAFLFIVSADLPKVPYMTLMDTYVISCFIAITCVALEATLAKAFNISHEDELPVIQFMLVAFFALQLVFAIVMLTAQRREWDAKMRPIYGIGPAAPSGKGKAQLIGSKDVVPSETESGAQNGAKVDLTTRLNQGESVRFIARRDVTEHPAAGGVCACG